MTIKYLQLALFIACGFYNSYAQHLTKEITLEDIYKNDVFLQKDIEEVISMNDGDHFTLLEDSTSIVKYSYETGNRIGIVLDVAMLKLPDVKEIYDYAFSGDEGKILISTNHEELFRHSFLADYYIVDMKTNMVTPLSDKGKQKMASFSPDGYKVAFVRDNNLFIKDILSGGEKQITTDGKYNYIINGAADWVYEEEFGFAKAYTWSGDGKKIAYFKFDESKVEQFNMTLYKGLYPENYTYKYPKAGENNSVVSVHVYDLASGQTKTMDIGREKDQYIPRIKWTKDESTLAIIRLNRLQNYIEVLFANATTGNSKVIYEEKSKYYISETTDDYITFLDDKKHFIVMGERDGYMHFYLYDTEGKLINQITKGRWDVNDFIGVDNKKNLLYYTSYEESSFQKHVYSIKFDGTDKKKLSGKDGWNDAEFSKTYGHYILWHTDTGTPNYISLHDSEGKLIKVLEDNKELVQKAKEYGFSRKELMTIKTSEGIDLNAYMIKPNDFDPGKKYPLFVYVYGGPESQNVRDSWDRYDPWFRLLTQKGYIVACVDNRGTNGRGEEFRKCTYMQLGKLETVDQIEAARYFGNLPYIDVSRIGIFGWSYGGYMTTLCMTKGADVFKMGIAVAPVTNWKYYDSVYTERFMRTPNKNTDGYDNNSPIFFIDKLKGAYLLVHGTGDDNVHLQNSLELAEALVQANKPFEMQFYKDRNHYVEGGNTRLHLFTRMTDFILKNL